MGRGCRYIWSVADRCMTRPWRITWSLLGAAAVLVLAVPDATAGSCTNTAVVAFSACFADALDNFLVSKGTCLNSADSSEFNDCLDEARTTRREDRTLCQQQRRARVELCGALGEDAYNPDFTAENFVNPLDIGVTVEPNPYFPLVQGNRWDYEITTPGQPVQTDTMVVTEDTKLIEGVTCVVVTDQVKDKESGVILEDTHDWYAQDQDGNVWYCGENTSTYQTFEGDNPQDPELQDIEGSWKTGREGAKPGILIEFAPKVGDIYRQEFLLGTAEDVAEVTSTTDSTGSTAANVNCAGTDGDCVVTHEFSPLEPDTSEDKYYKSGVGQILGVEGDTRTELTSFTSGSP
jgi:hypothetical protein